MGGEIIYMGKMGCASVVKVVTNMLAFIHLVAAGEAMMLPAKYGVDPDATYRAIRASSGNSFVHETESMLILSGSYNVKFTMDLACKDLGLVNSIAEKLGVPLELGSMTQQIFRRAQGLYGGQAQSPEVVRMLEKACGLELRADGYPTELVADLSDWQAMAAGLNIQTGLFIDGHYQSAKRQGSFASVNPATALMGWRGTWGMHCGVNLGVDAAALAQWVWVVGVKPRSGCCSCKALQEPRPVSDG
eukprot:gene30714-37971_t